MKYELVLVLYYPSARDTMVASQWFRWRWMAKVASWLYVLPTLQAAAPVVIDAYICSEAAK